MAENWFHSTITIRAETDNICLHRTLVTILYMLSCMAYIRYSKHSSGESTNSYPYHE